MRGHPRPPTTKGCTPTMKRSVFFSALAALSAGALLGAGTYAAFSDSETSAPQSLAAGTLDLVLGAEGDTLALAPITNMAPGDGGSLSVTMSNAGTIGGMVSFSVNETDDLENGCNDAEEADEAECDLDADGELGGALLLTVHYDGDDYGPFSVNVIDDDVLTFPLAAAGDLSGNDSKVVTIDYSLPSGTNNSVQSDSVAFEVQASLDQILS